MKERVRRVFRLDRRSSQDAQAAVDEELAFHIDAVAEELVARGWEPGDARTEAVRSFGDLAGTRAFCADVQTKRGRAERRTMSMEDLWSDVRYAARTLRKAPGYSGLVVATLAFGVAAATTIFSAMNPYLLRPLPYGDPDALVQVNQVNPVTGWDMDRFSYPQYEDWSARSRAFQSMGAYQYGAANFTGPEGPEQISYSSVTANLFGQVLRTEPFLGRGFTSGEGRPGGEPVVLLAESLWRRRYGGDPAVLGRAITVDGVQRTVVGVMPRSFNFPFGSARAWIPLQDDATAARGRMNLQIVGRLADGASLGQARGELSGIQAELSARFPDADGRMSGVTVKPLREALNFAWDAMSLSLNILLGAVVIVLLIACVNVASLTLARGGGRRREVAVRAALGASRGRVVRQLFAESVILAALAGVVGIGLTYWVTAVIAPVLPEDLYRVGDIDVDGKVLAFSLLMTLLTPLAFGLWPALSASRTTLTEGLKEGGRGSGGVGASRVRRALVVAQVALAVVLITGAGLMLRSMASAQRIDLGFDAGRIVVAEVALPATSFPSSAERSAYVERAVSELERTAGVVAASASVWIPLNHEVSTLQVASLGQVGAPAEEWPLSVVNRIYPGYFETLGTPVVEGRAFDGQDGPDGAPVVVVSRSLADRLWPGAAAVGQSLLAGLDPARSMEYTVVGVVEDVQHEDLGGSQIGTQVYMPALQTGGSRYFLLARTEGDPSTLVPGVREALMATDGNLPVEPRPMEAVVGENLLQWSIGSVLLTVFGTGALLLATLGIYGLISFSVSQRAKELGVRIALGATRDQIRTVVVGDGIRLTSVGLVLGVVAALGLARVAAAVLYGVSPSDPVTLAAVLAIFLGVAGLASYVPAVRASRTDPIGVLRAE